MTKVGPYPLLKADVVAYYIHHWITQPVVFVWAAQLSAYVMSSALPWGVVSCPWPLERPKPSQWKMDEHFSCLQNEAKSLWAKKPCSTEPVDTNGSSSERILQQKVWYNSGLRLNSPIDQKMTSFQWLTPWYETAQNWINRGTFSTRIRHGGLQFANKILGWRVRLSKPTGSNVNPTCSKCS